MIFPLDFSAPLSALCSVMNLINFLASVMNFSVDLGDRLIRRLFYMYNVIQKCEGGMEHSAA